MGGFGDRTGQRPRSKGFKLLRFWAFSPMAVACEMLASQGFGLWGALVFWVPGTGCLGIYAVYALLWVVRGLGVALALGASSRF